MTRRIKLIIIIIVCTVTTLLISLGIHWSYNFYWSHHPRVVISRVVGYGDVYGSGEDDKNERIIASFNERVPMADSVKEKVLELFNWVAGIDYELFETSYVPPYDIKVSGENEGGKVTLRYEGYVTTQDGETAEFFREGTFDIDLIAEEDFFINPPLSPLSHYQS